MLLLAAVGVYWYIQSQQFPPLSASPQFNNDPANIFTERPESVYKIGGNPDKITVVEDPQALGKEYLENLVNFLKTEKGDKVSRAKAVAQNFSPIGMSTYTGKLSGSGSALRLDDSGIYLTAAHVFLDKSITTKSICIYSKCKSRSFFS